MKRNRTLTLGSIALSLLLTASSFGFGWALVHAEIRRDFPRVERITPAALATWMNDDEAVPPLLLDVRTREEFEVSHLRNARQVDPKTAASALQEPMDRPIVTYCSVGYRSGAFAEKLRAAGYTRVVNLEGSIFRWANEGRPVYQLDQRVGKVHPYNRVWGLLLRKELRARVPSENAQKTKP